MTDIKERGDQMEEACGVFGIYAQDESINVAEAAYYGLFALQHRGQESAGIAVADGKGIKHYRNLGLVPEVFDEEILHGLTGRISIGHVRYSTFGSKDVINAQPLVARCKIGMLALAHNGNIVNCEQLRRELELEGSIFSTTSDTEVISYIITKERLKAPSIEQAVNQAMRRVKGAYSLVIMSPSKLIAVRDAHGFRPLCYGKTEDGRYVVASESCALDAVSAKFIRDIRPGEIVVFDQDGARSITDHCGDGSLCVFEYIYFARPDSVIDGCSVHNARMRAGAFLALEHPVQADVVIGVPDSGLDAAVGYAKQAGIPYEIGFIKNKYIGRTFIQPGQKSREDKVKIKLNPIADVVRGKRIVMIDDSIVRGTTSARIVKLLREEGAKEIHMRVSAPPFLNPCYYGTDIDSRENLIAASHSVEEIAKIIGVDSLGYLSVESVKQIAKGLHGTGYCTACFDGAYPTEIPETTSKNRFESKISAQGKKQESEEKL